MNKNLDTNKTEKKASAKNVESSKFTRFSEYLTLSKAELRKVSWPTVQETKKTSLVVFGFIAVMAILLGLVDLGLSSLVGVILS